MATMMGATADSKKVTGIVILIRTVHLDCYAGKTIVVTFEGLQAGPLIVNYHGTQRTIVAIKVTVEVVCRF